MGSRSWHARITCGGALGAGFLATDRHVLTCAHVVHRDDRAAVYWRPALSRLRW